jgi:hypothetical protein
VDLAADLQKTEEMAWSLLFVAPDIFQALNFPRQCSKIELENVVVKVVVDAVLLALEAHLVSSEDVVVYLVAELSWKADKRRSALAASDSILRQESRT